MKPDVKHTTKLMPAAVSCAIIDIISLLLLLLVTVTSAVGCSMDICALQLKECAHTAV